jgi:uracil phosphoribosyltransferase
MSKEVNKTPVGVEYKHMEMKFKGDEYCAVPILRSGDAMINSIFNMIPGINVGKILI